jgi:hypothetical protein
MAETSKPRGSLDERRPRDERPAVDDRAPSSPAASEPARSEAPSSKTASSGPRNPAPRAADVPAPEDGKSYVRSAQLPGGRKLELRGIAFSDTQPVVLINGKVLSPGEGVEGYTVVAIEPQRVQLKGASGTLYLTLQ